MSKNLKKRAKSNRIPESLITAIKRNKSFLICSHVNPEGDAIGSQIALRRLLLALKKTVHIVNSDKVPKSCQLIPGWRCIKSSGKGFSYEALLVLDCSDLSRIGKIKEKLKKGVNIINIDHHESSTYFGDINWVDPKASSVCEMIYELFDRLSVNVDKKSALTLYIGLVSDTGCFRYSNTRSRTLAIAAQLLKYKLPVYDIYRHIFGNITFSDIKLVTEALLKLRYNKKKKIAWLRLGRGLLMKKATEFDIGYFVLSWMRLIEGVEAAVVFKELVDRKDIVRMNFRSRGKINVSKIAALFGGGGHKTASGATARGNIDRIEKRVLKELYKKT